MDTQFIDLFTSTRQRDWGDILDYVTPKVTDEMNATLMDSVSVEEIKDAATQTSGLKAPRPDGFQGLFFITLTGTLLRKM